MKEQIHNQLESYLQAKGVDTRKPFHCLNPAHEDKHPSMSYDRNRKKAHCFSCGADYDTFDIIALEYNLTDFKEISAKAAEVFHGEHTYTQYIREKQNNINQMNYPALRGLSAETVAKFKLGFPTCEFCN